MMKLSKPITILLAVLALYGLFLLIRKLMNMKDKSYTYLIEPYSTTGCSCNKKGFFGGCKSGECCGVPKEKLLSGTSLTDKEREALVACPGYLDACAKHIKARTGQLPPNVVNACMNPSTIEEVVKRIF
jgi:hypothetical protein